MSRSAICTLCIVLIVLFASAGHAATLSGALPASFVDNAGKYVLVLEDGPGEVPELTGKSTLVILGSNLLRVPNLSLTNDISNGFFHVTARMLLEIEFGQNDLIQPSNLVSRAAAKLTAEESSAFLSTATALVDGYKYADPECLPGLDQVMESYREIMEFFNKPLTWLGPNGEEYEYHGDFLREVYGFDPND